MTRCAYKKVGTCCRCEKCADMLMTAQRIVDRGVDLRDLHEYIRPWVLVVREERCTPLSSGGAGAWAGPVDDDAGPWGENAIGELEDYDDGTETQ